MPHETPFDNNSSGMVRRWRAELQLADKAERDWREQSRKIIHRYRDDEEMARHDVRYNVLWANTETLRPQMFSQTPSPVVRRRFMDDDPVGANVAQVLERALEYSIDAYDFHGTIDKAITDYLLPGRAVARIRYIPEFAKMAPPKIPVALNDDGVGNVVALADRGNGPERVAPDQVQRDGNGNPYVQGEPEEELVYEEVRCEYVNWEDFRMSPARTWEETRWVAFRHRMTRDELRKAFGVEKAQGIPLDFNAQEKRTNEDSDQQHVSKRATVWEIWHKDTRELIFISEGKPDEPIEVRPDPLKLSGFFPIPEPLYSIKTNNTMVPIPEYTLYQDQAIELDRITSRIVRLVEALKARGLYAGDIKDELTRLMQGTDNELIPVADFGAINGTLEDKIAWMPIEQIAKTLTGLYQQRDQILQIIYQVTGIADIMRGNTNPNEGVGTQRLKSQFGVQRLQPRQHRVQKFIRDLLELKAEVMAEMFDPQTLQLMTGQQIDPQALQVMRENSIREFRIDIETDSTIAQDEQSEKEAVSEMFQAMGGFMNSMVPAVQGGAITREAAKEIVLWGLRRFRVTREVEDALKQTPQPEPPQPDPVEMAKIENERLKITEEAQNKRAQRQLDMMKLRLQADEQEDENMRHAIDALIEQAKNDDQVFTAAVQELGKLSVDQNKGSDE